ncbi:hypothetical protein BH09BAC6_BH09BAC6_21840 [soil metagenome]|jgi:hypothetical protein
MGKKLGLNVLYNIGIFLCLILGYEYGIVQQNFVLLTGAVVLVTLLVLLKIKLIKDIKNTQKPNP